jgi:hypothetical protein
VYAELRRTSAAASATCALIVAKDQVASVADIIHTDDDPLSIR